MQSFWSFILGVLENEGSSAEQKDGAIDALVDLSYELIWENKAQIPDGVCERIIEACGQEIIRHADNDESPRVQICKLIDSMLMHLGKTHRQIRNDMISVIFNHEMIVPFIFEGVIHTENKSDKESFCFVLIDILEYSSVSDRIALIIRYFEKLRSWISTIFTRELLNTSDMTKAFFRSIEMAGVVATMPSELYKWAIEEGTFATQNECLFNVLESAIDSPKTMEKLLGYGLLSISHDFAHLPINQATLRHANIFRGIILIHPEFSQLFRRLTCDGVMGNPTADYGRTIPHRVQTVGVNYILVDEDSDL